jgi:hypothetical protein
MRKNLLLAALAVGATALFAWTVLDRGTHAVDAGSPLDFAPADTPYAAGMIEPFPESLMTQWLDQMDPSMQLYAAQLRRAARQGGTHVDAQVPVALLFEALADEIEGRTLRAAMAEAGISPQGRMAFYGVGPVPVLRWELADPDAFHAFVDRLEQGTGEALPVAMLGEQPYWRLSMAGAPIEAIAAVVGSHLVISLAPATLDPALLETLLGLRAPDRSVLDAGLLDALAGRLGYQRSFLGFLDNRRVAALATDAPTPLMQAWFDALGLPPIDVGEACRTEYAALAESWPMASFGYTRLDARQLDMRMVLETSPAIAADLMTLRSPMPASGAVPDDAMFNLGLSLDINAVPALVNRHANAIIEKPYRCGSLAWLNSGAEGARGGINNPAVFAAAPVFRGFHAIIEHVELDQALQLTRMSGALLIGSNNPQSLVAMAAMAVPQVATLDLKPDGRVVPLSLPPIPGAPSMPTWVSMTDHLLGIGFGDGADARLPAYMTSDADRQPIFLIGYSGRSYDTIADVMEHSAANLPDAAARADMQQQAAMMRDVYARMLERGEMRLEFTSHGIELLQEARVRP